jgi:hypothetical protein
MTPVNRRQRRVPPGRHRDARMRRVFDGVVASYIRDISVRTASGAGQGPRPAADAPAA